MNKKGSQIDRLKVRAEEGDVSDDKCTNTGLLLHQSGLDTHVGNDE